MRSSSSNFYSIGEEQVRDQVNTKIDHNLSAKHKINVGWTYERAHSDDVYATWPNGWGGSHYSPADGPDVQFHLNRIGVDPQ